jgi:hypothetical protein
LNNTFDISPTLLVAHLHFCHYTIPTQKMQKSNQANAQRQTIADRQTRPKKTTPYNSTYPKGGVSCSKNSFVVNQTLVFQIKFCGKSPALRVAAKRWVQA